MRMRAMSMLAGCGGMSGALARSYFAAFPSSATGWRRESSANHIDGYNGMKVREGASCQRRCTPDCTMNPAWQEITIFPPLMSQTAFALSANQSAADAYLDRTSGYMQRQNLRFQAVTINSEHGAAVSVVISSATFKASAHLWVIKVHSNTPDVYFYNSIIPNPLLPRNVATTAMRSCILTRIWALPFWRF